MEEELYVLAGKIKNFKNPEELKITTNINKQTQNNVFVLIKNMEPKEIIEKFYGCGNLDANEFKLFTKTENDIKKEISNAKNKMRKLLEDDKE